MADNYPGAYDLQDGLISLIGAMLKLAAQDFKRGKGKKDDVIEFLESEWFLEICDCLDINAREVKKRISNEEQIWPEKD